MGLFEPDFSHLDSMTAEDKMYELSVAYETPKGPEFVSIFHGPDLKPKET